MKFKVLSIILISFITLNAQEVIDKIVAVVDDEIITQSELEFQLNMYAQQRNVSADNPALKNQLLNSMIEEKLVYAQAVLDSMQVSPEEIDNRLDYQINMFIQRFGSQERVEEVYGMSIERIKRESRDEIRKQLMIQRLRETKFSSVEATRREVVEFFKEYKDSLGVIPEKVLISHIYRNPKASEILKKKYRSLAEDLLDSLKNGADFSELAKEYSDDPGSAKQGGDLGFVNKGVFYPEFESAAFALEEGEISGVVESPVGFHIIQLLERRGESIHTRHILIKIKKDDDADLQTIEFLSEIRDSIVNGYGTFDEYAKKYSEDEDTKAFGGELGSFYLNQLDKPMLEVVSKLDEGEISFPRRIEFGQSEYGYHIVYLEKRTPQHEPKLEVDFSEIKRIADEYKRQQQYEDWIAELKEKIYWDIRI